MLYRLADPVFRGFNASCAAEREPGIFTWCYNAAARGLQIIPTLIAFLSMQLAPIVAPTLSSILSVNLRLLYLSLQFFEVGIPSDHFATLT